MDFDTANKIVQSISYKPNFKIFIFKHFLHDSWILAITMYVPDANNPECTIPIRQHSSIHPKDMTKAVLTSYVQVSIRTMETHEHDEWFKVDGIALKNPHAEDRKRA